VARPNAAPWDSHTRQATLALAGRVRLALAVELPWLTLLPLAEAAEQALVHVPFQLPPGADGERFAAAVRAERVPIERWPAASPEAGPALALPIAPTFGEEDVLHAPLAVAKAAHFLLRASPSAPWCAWQPAPPAPFPLREGGDGATAPAGTVAFPPSLRGKGGEGG